MSLNRRYGPILFLVLALLAPTASGQERTLDISSNVDSAAVFVDNAWVGRVLDGPFRIAPAARMVSVRLPRLSAWSVESLTFDLEEYEGDSIQLSAAFPFHYRFESIPSGATVFHGATTLGRTPFVHVAERPLSEVFRVKLDGYLDATLAAGSDIWNMSRVELVPDAMTSQAIVGDHIVPKKRKDWVSIAATASAFAAGALAIHFRTKADNRFDDYQVSGKESLRSDVQRLDVQSGVALGVMHAGLGVVVFRLAF